jgi:site-specific recombinase XerD
LSETIDTALAACSAALTTDRAAPAPALIARAGTAAGFAWDEFFFGSLRNSHTRRAYQYSATRFFNWCHARGLELRRIAPAHVGRYLDGLPVAPTTKKLHLAAIRRLFDLLVNRHAVILNPAASVRTERYEAVEGKTPEITIEQARLLLKTINKHHVIGLRDRAIIAVLIYTAARIGAVAKLQRQHLYETADQFCLRFSEKLGKSREIPVRHDLKRILFDYLDAANLTDAPGDTSFFRSTIRRTKQLTARAMTTGDMNRMVKRRMRDAGLPARLCPHSFRVTTITDLLSQGVPLEEVQHLAGHADPRTTRLYDRRQRRVTRNIVERISV